MRCDGLLWSPYVRPVARIEKLIYGTLEKVLANESRFILDDTHSHTKKKQPYFKLFVAKMEPRGILIGSNAAVNSVEFDSTGTMVLATSNDYASRVWTVSDQRLRVS